MVFLHRCMLCPQGQVHDPLGDFGEVFFHQVARLLFGEYPEPVGAHDTDDRNTTSSVQAIQTVGVLVIFIASGGVGHQSGTVFTFKMMPQIVAVLLLYSFSGQAATVVTPTGYASLEGDRNNGAPFDIGGVEFGINTMRYQQVYNASLFSALGGPQMITQIAFRPDGLLGSAYSVTLPNIQINLSTTAATATSLSTVFNNNVGGDDMVVYSGALSLSTSYTGEPKNFDIIINLTTPFLYNPGAGDLLMDVRNFGGGASQVFDAVSSTSLGVARVYSSALRGANGVNDATGFQDATTAGLVTQFTTTSVPEPSVVGLVSAVAICATGFRRGRGRRKS